MKTAAIIAEYNPLHNGHVYQIEYLKNIEKVTHIVVLMSGSFVQRGGPAIYDKMLRAETAIRNGADLILQLPYVYSAQTAELFAKGAVSIIDKINPEILCFGCENDDFELFHNAANILIEEPFLFKQTIEQSLSEGNSFAASRLSALEKCSQIDCSFLKLPNNILALEYIKSLMLIKSNVKPLLLKRATGDNYAAASHIRNIIYNGGNPSEFIPCAQSRAAFHNFEEYAQILKSYLLLISDKKLDETAEMENGLGARMKKNFYKLSFGCDDFIQAICTKRYTKSRIRRILINTLMGFTKKDFLFYKSYTPGYVRALGFNQKGRELLNNIKDIKVVTNPSKSFSDFTDNDKYTAKFDYKADELFSVNSLKPYDDMHIKPFVLE